MSGLPQKLLDLLDKATSRGSRSPDEVQNTDTLPLSTRIVAFDNTAFSPPPAASSCTPFPSGLCPSPSPNYTEYPPRPSEQHTHIAEFVIAYLSSRSGEAGIIDDIVANVVSALGIVPRNGPEEENVRRRVAMFVGWMKPLQRAVVVADSGERIVCGPSSGNGISADLRWVGGRPGREVVWKVLTSPEDRRVFEMRTFMPAQSGWVVISDVDDTIKVSQVNNRLALLRNTFVSEPSSVQGMPELYHAINARLNPAWFYLSASPWQLYPFLHDFLRTQSQNQTLYPPGQLILRDMNRGAMPFYLSALTMGTQAYKTDRLSKVHSWLPEPTRRAILIGDSTQTDPEAYGEIARKWPGWVAAIWIRVVKGVDEKKERELNVLGRFEKAFTGLDRNLWRTFENPKELESIVATLK